MTIKKGVEPRVRMKGGGGDPPAVQGGAMHACMQTEPIGTQSAPPPLTPSGGTVGRCDVNGRQRAAADSWVGCAPSEDALACQYNTGPEPTRLDEADFGSQGAPEMLFIPTVGVPKMPRCTQVVK